MAELTDKKLLTLITYAPPPLSLFSPCYGRHCPFAM